jgi:hypothetical protein
MIRIDYPALARETALKHVLAKRQEVRDRGEEPGFPTISDEELTEQYRSGALDHLDYVQVALAALMALVERKDRP